MARLIFHVDVNSAFLSWEAARRVAAGEEDLRLVPSAVGGDPKSRRSIIAAKSIPAKRYDIKTGEPVSLALEKCPQLIVVKPDMELYKSCSRAFIAICRKYAPKLEQFSIDECFLDMSDCELIYPDPIETATKIKDEIRDTLGFTVNIGIGDNKLLAKMASDFTKPDRVHTLYTSQIKEKMWPLPVSDLFLAGKSCADRLNRFGIHTIGQLAQSSLSYVQSVVGDKMGAVLYNYANGIDESEVTEETEDAKSYSMSVTLEDDVTTLLRGKEIIRSLAESVSAKMRKDHARAYCVSVTIRDITFHNRSHQCKLENATDISEEIYETAAFLFEELWDTKTPLRLLNVGLSNVTKDSYEQITLFDTPEREKKRKVDMMMDSLQDRFGHSVVQRASAYASKTKK